MPATGFFYVSAYHIWNRFVRCIVHLNNCFKTFE